MTKCRRDNCDNLVSRFRLARQKRLCDDHYLIFLSGADKREWRKNTRCGYSPCQNTLSGTRNEKYCSAVCRQRDSRKFDNLNAESILSSSYWSHMENAIKRNLYLLGSVSKMGDIVNYYHLYIRKSRHQRSYTPQRKGRYEEITLVPLFYLDISHLYPNAKGGASAAENLIIAPSFINRRNNDVIPYQGQGFGGVRSAGELIPFNGSLYDSLTARFGSEEVNTALSEITPAKCFYGNVPREIEFGGIEQQLPLFTLLHEELWRLGHHKTSECLSEIRQLFPEYPLYLELLAIVGFHAVLSGDPDRIMALLCRIFNKCFNSTSLLREPHKKYLSLMYCFLRKYLIRYFSVETDNREAVVAFYNGFYSQEIIAPGDAEDEVLCYRYSIGIKSYTSTFFYVPPQKKEPVDLWRLMGDDLTFE